DGDATVATGGDGHGQGDELAGFFAEVGVFGIGVGEGLVTADRVGREFHEVGELGADLFLIIIPIEHHVRKPPEVVCRAGGVYDKGWGATQPADTRGLDCTTEETKREKG